MKNKLKYLYKFCCRLVQKYKAQVEAVEKLLDDFNKYKIIVKEEVIKKRIKEIQNLDRPPAPTSWAVFNGFGHSAELAKY